MGRDAQRLPAADSRDSQAAEGRGGCSAGDERAGSVRSGPAGGRSASGGGRPAHRGGHAPPARAAASHRDRAVHGRAHEGSDGGPALSAQELGDQTGCRRGLAAGGRARAAPRAHRPGREAAMRERELAILWIALAVVFVGSLLGLLQYSRALRTSGIQAAAERARLTAAIDQKQKEILIEMKSNAGVLQEMSWSGTTGDPAVFLSRVAELAEGSRLRVLGVGPLEQQTTPQFSKSWHALTVQGPFQDLVALASRVEGDRGTLEAMAIDVPPRSTQAAPAPGQRGAAINPEIQARFRVTALQLTPQARKIIDDAARASGVSLTPPTPQTGLALPVPSPASEYRDRSEEHTSELQSHSDLVCRLLLEKKKTNKNKNR